VAYGAFGLALKVLSDGSSGREEESDDGLHCERFLNY
jgi:hypothetical protein